ncbi:transcriptional regulator [Streptomyces sp. SudanB182_2057]|uniref:transcriptional regulator n=1 Tax=Streptomyces sp. SudanB182_2057 TaxID=3035281 RepID=UPI003F5560B5
MVERSRTSREANERLRAVMEEAGCSSTGLARRVNLCGAEHGLDLRYDKTSVARWLRGQQPRGRVPAVIAEALERKLGRLVTVEEIGMKPAPGTASAVGLRFEPNLLDALHQACALWRSDANHVESLSGTGLATSVLVQASRDWLISDLDPAPTNQGPHAVGSGDIAAIRATTSAFADLDHRFGGGHTRQVTVLYLHTVVAGLLMGAYDEPTGRQLLSAVARLSELAGYMAVDSGLLGLAQRYYIQALRLAQAAGDRGFGGYVLAGGMSQVALAMGNPRETVQLGRVAREGTGGHVTAPARALFHLTEARGYALLGDQPACEHAAGEARKALKEQASGEEPDWAVHIDRGYLAEQLARCYHDLNQPAAALRWAEESLRGISPQRPRRRALRLLLTASAHLRLGHVEESCATALEAVDALGRTRSARCSSELADFRDRLEALGLRAEARLLPVPEQAG